MKNKKFKEDSEMSQPSAGQPAFTSGRDEDKLEEMSSGATGSGSIATVAAPIGKMQKRAKGSIFSGIATSEKFPNSKAVKESNDYFKRRKDEEDRIAGTKPPAERKPKQTDYEKKRKDQKEVAEGQISEDDIILMPGQGRKLKPGLISKRHDNEVEMARGDLYQTAKDAKEVCDMLKSVSEMQGLDGWVQAKITKAADYLSSVRKFLESKTAEVDEGRGFRGVGGARSREDDEGYSKGGNSQAKEYNDARAEKLAKARKDTMDALLAAHKKKQGVAEGSLNEFAPDGFNGGDDGEEFNPRLAKMAYDEGIVKGASLADGATLERAMAINDWDKHDGGIYKQHFAKGFKKGRLDKINFNNKQYNLNLKLMKDGSIRHGEQGVAEGLPQTLRKVVPGHAKREIDKKMDAEKFGRTDVDKDANYYRYKKIQDKLKEQGVAEAEQPTSREKFNKGLKKAGYDPEKGANRLFSLLSKQAAEREKFEKDLPAVYDKQEKEVDEGMFDRFKKKPEAKPQRMPITAEQRAFIKQYFPTNHNADITWGRKDSDDYVLPDNVTVHSGKGLINFINHDGKLIANVALHRNAEDRMNIKASPLLHFDITVNSGEDLEKLKSELAEGVVEGLKDPADNPCWKGYKPVGTKKKNGKTVPNCVPKK